MLLINGIRTARLAERAEVFGWTPQELAHELALDVRGMRSAISYEFAA